MIFYPENVFNEEEEYAGQGYVDGETRVVAYKRDGYIYVYEGNDRIGKYKEDNFTIMETLYLASAGISVLEDRSHLNEEDYEDLDRVSITDIYIAGNSQQYKYDL